jgi:hypothetical protein
MHPELLGLAPSPPEPPSAVAVLVADAPKVVPAPPWFRIVAIMTAFNERDIIRPTVERLIADGIAVHLIDNWSVDGTAEQVHDLVGRGVLEIERFPHNGPPTFFDLTGLLARVSEVARSLDAHWCIHHDVDQRRDAPWPGVSLRDAIYRVDRWGFNAIDHTLLEFRPVDNGYREGSELSGYFRHIEFAPGTINALQVQVWKNDQPVDLVTSGGHDVAFCGRRVFPFNFVLRHYPIRSQQHGERKVFQERQPRYPDAEIDRGWHHHYTRLRRGHRFVYEPSRLVEFVDGEFQQRFLLPMIGRIGVPLAAPSAGARAHRTIIGALRRLGLLPLYANVRRHVRRRARRSHGE